MRLNWLNTIGFKTSLEELTGVLVHTWYDLCPTWPKLHGRFWFLAYRGWGGSFEIRTQRQKGPGPFPAAFCLCFVLWKQMLVCSWGRQSSEYNLAGNMFCAGKPHGMVRIKKSAASCRFRVATCCRCIELLAHAKGFMRSRNRFGI